MGFPGGSALRNLSANAGDTGSVLDPEDPMCHRAAQPIHHQLLSLCSRAWEIQLLHSRATATEACQPRAPQEKPPQ